MKVPITQAVLDEADFQIIQEPLKSGWIVQGPYVEAFENAFANFTKSKYTIASSSCTTALHISLAALGIGPGDEIIVPAFTWIATANCIEYLGAKPIFCDIDLNTFNIDIQQIENKISHKTKAIIPVHLFGLAAEMDALMEMAKKYHLFVIEDAACGFGAYYKGKHVGNFGDFGCFSFHPRKAITTGEGGMITTQDPKRAELCRSLRTHGADRSDLTRHKSKASFLLPEFHYLGYNYRMTDIQGALGISQIKKADWIQKQRTERAKRYDVLLKNISWLKIPFVPKACIHGYQSYVCLFQPKEPNIKNVNLLHQKRNKLMLELEAVGISTRQGTHAVTTLAYYQKKYSIHNQDYPIAFLADRISMALPLYAQMTDEEQDYVVENLKRIYKKIK